MGFAAEVKDFLNAWQAGEKITASQTDREYKKVLTDAAQKKTVRDNDPDTLALQDETARARLKHLQAQTGATGASTALTNERRNALKLRQKLLQDQYNAQPTGSGLLPPGVGGVNAGAGALPLQNTMTLGDDEEPQFAGGGAVPARYSDERLARGGRTLEEQQRLEAMLPENAGALPIGPAAAEGARKAREDRMKRLYEDGGLVPEEEPVLEVPEAPEEDMSTGDMGDGPMPTDVSSQSRRGSLNGLISPQLVSDARKHGMIFGAKTFGLDQVGGIRTNRQRIAAQQYAQGKGGLSDEEMAAVKKSIDPQGKLSEAQRNIAALGSVYQYQMNKGNPEGAQRIAFQMLQHYRAASQRYAAIAAHAVEQGDLDLATKAAVQAYANVPDGRDLAIFKDEDGRLNYSYTDAQTGKTIAKGIATPQQLASSAMGLAQGGFDKALIAAAGAEPDNKAKKGGGALKVTDRKNLAAMADEPVTKFKDEYEARMEKEKLQPLDPEYLGNLRDATQHIMTDNPKATAREAFNAARSLYTLDKDDPGKSNFKVEKLDDEEGMNKIKFSSGHSIKLSDDQLEPILMQRAATLKARDAADDAEEDAKDDTGIMGKIGAVGSAIGDAASDVWSAIKARDPKVQASKAAASMPDVNAMPQ